MSAVGPENCFRWEVVNGTKSPEQDIDELSWPVAGIRARPLHPGDKYREFNNRREQIQAERKNNPVYAFENEMTPTESWLVAPGGAPKPQSSSGPSYKFMQTKVLLPALRGAEPSMLNAIVSVLSLESGQAAPDISQIVGFGDVAIRITSGVTFDGNMMRISTDAVVINAPSGEMQFNAPALTALQKTAPKGLGDPIEAEQFLSSFREAVRGREPNRKEWNVQLSVDTRGSRDVFRIRQPVIVSLGQDRHCYLVATYTPVPIGLTLQECW